MYLVVFSCFLAFSEANELCKAATAASESAGTEVAVDLEIGFDVLVELGVGFLEIPLNFWGANTAAKPA
jgi:hypothetical protein